jgi:flagellar protein FlbB
VAGRGTIGRVVVLFILILLLSAGGLLWFDYLGIIQSRQFFSPVYKLFGLEPRAGISTLPQETGDLDADRIAKRLEAVDLRSQELDLKENELTRKEGEVLQMSQELDDRLVSVEERERSFTETLRQTNDRAANVKQIAEYINGMPPKAAVANLLAMDDQDIIDILRQVEANAVADGKTSSVAYWFSLMPAARAAEIQRKMANKPVTLP